MMRRTILCAFIATVAQGPAMAQSVEDFYRGKVVRFMTGYGAGTGYDVYMRVVQRHIGKHIPGQPNVVPENMPGAGGLVMTNYLYNVAPRDGTAIGMPSRELVTEPLLGNKDARFDAQKFGWIGSVSTDVATCLGWRASGFIALKDVMSREIKIGANGPQTASAIMPRLLNALIGTKFRIYNGYPDSGAVGLAMEQGEVDGYCGFTLGSVRSARPVWLEKNLVAVVTQMGVQKHPDLPDVPNPLDLMQDEGSKQAFLLVFGAGRMGRPIATPPGVPADRVRALRKAFQDTLKDPEFLEDIRTSKIDFDGPADGDTVAQLIKGFYATPQSVIDRVATIKNSYD
jgi:tripartite-type tricarboxylate transporter receptor subunit TctC